MAKKKRFMIMAKCYRDVSLEVMAETLEEALMKAKELKDDDFVGVYGDYNDGTTEVYGVFEA